MVLKTFILILSILIFYFLSASLSPINNKIKQSFSKLAGEHQPDSCIIIIHISSSDIDNIGPWPIKRSYYALLINELKKLSVKKIGVEVFLSSRIATQTVYDNLLTREIIKAENVVLSSLTGEIYLENNNYKTDSLSYPSSKLLEQSIKTGHINFIEENGHTIPLKVESRREKEKAFALMLSEKQLNEKEINVNILSNWKKFANYSLHEFFNLVQDDDEKLLSFKNKIVIVGVSDPQIAKTIQTSFEDEMPGVALHAFALDNILNDRSLILISPLVSLIFGGLFLFIVLLLSIKKDFKSQLFIYLSALVFILALGIILLNYFQIVFSYTLIIFPLIGLFVFDGISESREGKVRLANAIDENQLLEVHLRKKENELAELQYTHKNSDQKSEKEIANKIKLLQEEIDRLNSGKEDEVEAEIVSDNRVKNFHGIIYRSKVMGKVVDLVMKTAPEEATILILGESGTGKELIAKAVHNLSSRKDKNFIAVNCGALPDTLLESELFGHVKGAFTGAVSDKIGRFEAADKGTIFLDEIGETSESFQVKLLRVLQSGEFEKVGSSKTFSADVRVVAATNKNLESLIKEKKFREDLYYRLNVIKIDLPPLRDRREDVEVIADYFIRNENSEIGFSKSVLEALNKNDWKGNIRELESVIKRAVIFAKSSERKLIQLNDLPEDIVKKVKYNFEDLVLHSLREKGFSHSSISETAAELGNVNRTVISENFRGIFFKEYVESNYEFDQAVRLIAGTDDEEIIEKVKSKCDTFISNLTRDIEKHKGRNFEELKLKFASKYKNLPVRYHAYLDDIIKKNI